MRQARDASPHQAGPEMSEGWIKLHRKLLESEAFKGDGAALAVFVVMLMKANFKDDGNIPVGHVQISQAQIEQATGFSRKVVRRVLLSLRRANVATPQRANAKFKIANLYRIEKWAEYQALTLAPFGSEGQRGSPSEGQLLYKEEYQKKEKNLKVQKKEKYAPPQAETGSDVDLFGEPLEPEPAEVSAEEMVRKLNLAESLTVPIPEWLASGEWEEFLAHRAAMLKAKRLSRRAISGLITRLDRWRTAGHDPIELIRVTVENGWLAPVDPDELKGKRHGITSASEGSTDNLARAFEDIRNRERANQAREEGHERTQTSLPRGG